MVIFISEIPISYLSFFLYVLKQKQSRCLFDKIDNVVTIQNTFLFGFGSTIPLSSIFRSLVKFEVEKVII